MFHIWQLIEQCGCAPVNVDVLQCYIPSNCIGVAYFTLQFRLLPHFQWFKISCFGRWIWHLVGASVRQRFNLPADSCPNKTLLALNKRGFTVEWVQPLQCIILKLILVSPHQEHLAQRQSLRFVMLRVCGSWVLQDLVKKSYCVPCGYYCILRLWCNYWMVSRVYLSSVMYLLGYQGNCTDYC